MPSARKVHVQLLITTYLLIHYYYLNILDKLIIGKFNWRLRRFVAGTTWTDKVEAMYII